MKKNQTEEKSQKKIFLHISILHFLELIICNFLLRGWKKYLIVVQDANKVFARKKSEKNRKRFNPGQLISTHNKNLK